MSRKASFTALDWILLRVINFALVPRLGPEINSRVSVWVSPRPRQRVQCWLTNQRPSLVCRSRLETPRAGSGPKKLRAEPPLANPSAISLPRIPACPGTQKRYTACRAEMSFSNPLALMNQRGRCSDDPKSFQGRQAVGANTHVFLRSILRHLSYILSLVSVLALSIKNCYYLRNLSSVKFLRIRQ